jgi:hypothetical protein
MCHNGKENPIGIETILPRIRIGTRESHNGKENPIGIETGPGRVTSRSVQPCHNGKENPIGIETVLKVPFDSFKPGHNGKENPIGIETFAYTSRRTDIAGSQWKRKPDRD